MEVDLRCDLSIVDLESAKSSEEADEEVDDVYMGLIWVFANISGMITFLPDGAITSINNNFALMLFGYSAEELIGKVGACKVCL